MQGLLGWLAPGGREPEPILDAMLAPGGRPRPEALRSGLEPAWGLAAWGAGADLARNETLAVALIGRPNIADGAASATAAEVLRLWAELGRNTLERLHGSFALAVLDSHEQSIVLAVDRVGSRSLAFAARPDGFVFANRADSVAAHPDVGTSLDRQGIFNYFYFHNLPAPGSIFRGVEKLLPGQWLRWQQGRVERGFYWRLRYRDTPRYDFRTQSRRFRELLGECVLRARGNNEVAAFLSGGTDSSTLCGMLTQLQGRPARAYTIGFAAQDYDEMEYARLAARHFNLDAREYYVKPDDILSALSFIARHYDEPFANESAVPTLYCARMAAADGYRVMLAGDGGDELFGGRAQYARQKVFEAYHVLPAFLRKELIEPLAHLPGLEYLPPLRKLQSYIRQANIPMPERMESYNFVYRQPLEEMFSPGLLRSVDTRLPGARLKEAYERADSASYINRMLHLDLEFSLAYDNLRKVNGMSEAAGIEVRYPLLDDAMLAFSGEIPPDWKIRGLYLRWFYRKSLTGFLPQEIIDRRKQGFKLPFGVWAREHAPLRERVLDRLSDFNRRGWLRPKYIERTSTDHSFLHAPYFGKMLWVIVTLEEWLQARGL